MWQQLEMAAELKSDLQETELRQEVACWFQCWKKFCFTGIILCNLVQSFSSILDWTTNIISIAKIASKKIGAFIHSMKFLSPHVALFSINLPCSLPWTTVAISGPVLLPAYEGLFTCCLSWNLGSLLKFGQHLFYRCYFNELALLVLLSYSWGRSTHYSHRFHGFSVAIPRCLEYIYVNSFFLTQLYSGIVWL